MQQVEALAKRAKEASRSMAMLGQQEKNAILVAMADALEARAGEVIAANALDVARAREAGRPAALVDRLALDETRVAAMAQGLRDLARLEDPVGMVERMWTRPNGLRIGEKRVPLGLVAIIYEARPNVTVDSVGLCLKSGNAAILRGGSEAIASNRALVDVLQQAAAQAGCPKDAFVLIADTDRASATALMTLNGIVDVLIPRGGAGLIRSVVQHATVPVIETGTGVCHVYVDDCADWKMATDIIVNAKVSRPAVCNAAETLLVHRDIAADFLPQCIAALRAKKVEIRGCDQVRAVAPDVVPATEEDWGTEYHDLILSVKVVADIDEAIAHITRYGTRHSESIVTRDIARAQRFLDEVDAACVYVNASTRFSDGFEFGFGAEIGISNQKLHARGPMGLKALTTTKYIIIGSGQVRI
nr:glutamate-5-semialdehyde dehydrogenase [Maliibacterium massiliense]